MSEEQDEKDMKMFKRAIREVVAEELEVRGLKKHEEDKKPDEKEEKAYSECVKCSRVFRSKGDEDRYDICPECGGTETRKL